MATVKFIQRTDKKNVLGEAPIYAQYKHLDGKVLFSTGKKIEPRYWNKSQGKVKKHDDATTLNSYLNSFGRKILKFATELQDEDTIPTHDRVDDAYHKALIDKLPEAHLTKSIIYQWKDYLKSKQNTVKPLTLSNQTNSLEALETFLREEKCETLRPEAFTIRHLMKWGIQPK